MSTKSPKDDSGRDSTSRASSMTKEKPGDSSEGSSLGLLSPHCLNDSLKDDDEVKDAPMTAKETSPLPSLYFQPESTYFQPGEKYALSMGESYLDLSLVSSVQRPPKFAVQRLSFESESFLHSTTVEHSNNDKCEPDDMNVTKKEDTVDCWEDFGCDHNEDDFRNEQQDWLIDLRDEEFSPSREMIRSFVADEEQCIQEKKSKKHNSGDRLIRSCKSPWSSPSKQQNELTLMGQFFRQGSGAIGNLEGESDNERPHFESLNMTSESTCQNATDVSTANENAACENSLQSAATVKMSSNCKEKELGEKNCPKKKPNCTMSILDECLSAVSLSESPRLVVEKFLDMEHQLRSNTSKEIILTEDYDECFTINVTSASIAGTSQINNNACIQSTSSQISSNVQNQGQSGTTDATKKNCKKQGDTDFIEPGLEQVPTSHDFAMRRFCSNPNLHSSAHQLMTVRPKSVSNGTGAFSVPPTIAVSRPVTKGISTKVQFSGQNHTSRWLSCQVQLHSVYINGVCEKQRPHTVVKLHGNLSFQVMPQKDVEMKVHFTPLVAGKLRVVLNISVIDVTQKSATDATNTAIILEVEEPQLSVVFPQGSNCLDYGLLAEGCCLSLPLSLITKKKAALPLRVEIHEEELLTEGFFFCQEQEPKVTYVTPGLALCHLEEDVLTSINIICKAPTLNKDLPQPQGIQSMVSLNLDSESKLQELAQVRLRVRVGRANISFCPSALPFTLQAASGSTTSRTPISVWNEGGNMAVLVSAKVALYPEAFFVQPQQLKVDANTETIIYVCFQAPKDVTHLEDTLILQVLPDGKQHELWLQGEVVPSSLPSSFLPLPDPLPSSTSSSNEPFSNPLVNSRTAPKSMLNVIGTLDPKRQGTFGLAASQSRLSWGCVARGQESVQKLTVTNLFPAETLSLQVYLEGNGFKVQREFDGMTTFPLTPQEKCQLVVTFAPSEIGPCSARLFLRSSSKPSLPARKFQVALLGIGGQSHVLLERVTRDSDGNLFCIPESWEGEDILGTSILLVNNGDLVAFVLAVPEKDSGVSVVPERLLLAPGAKAWVNVHCPCPRENLSTEEVISTIWIVSVEDITRVRYCRALNLLGKKGINCCPNSLLSGIDLNHPPSSENMHLLPSDPNDIKTFGNNLRIVPVRLKMRLRGEVVRLPAEDTLSTTMVNGQSHQNLTPPTCLPRNLLPSELAAGSSSASVNHFSEGTDISVTDSTISKIHVTLASEPDKPPEAAVSALAFPPTVTGTRSCIKIRLRNHKNVSQKVEMDIKPPEQPFHTPYNQLEIRPRFYLGVPVYFSPKVTGFWEAKLYLKQNGAFPLILILRGLAISN